MQRDTGWRPMAPTLTLNKGEFSFLIAFGKQLERACELAHDGSAPDWLTEALGVLANALEGVSGQHVEPADAGEGDDGDGLSYVHLPGGVRSEVGGRPPRQRGRGASLDAAMEGLRANNFATQKLEHVEHRASPVAKQPKPGARPNRGTRGKKSKKSR